MPDKNTIEQPDFKTERERYVRPVREIRRARKELKRVRIEMKRQRKQRPTPGGRVFWGLMLILWAVLIFALEQKWLPAGDLWKAFLVGLGAIFIIRAILNYFDRESRPYSVSRVIPGIILTCIGLGLLFNFNAWWPLVLVIAGVAVLFFSWFLQREIEKGQITRETLHESEVKYRHIIDNANSVIMEIGTGGNITFINKFGLDFFGFREDEIIGRSMSGTILPSAPPGGEVNRQMIEDIADSPEKYLHYETENLRKNGDRVWITWTCKPIFDEANNVREVLCIGIDSTQQKKQEETAARQLKEKTAEEERTRLARDLHDAVSQTLFSASLIADVLPRLWERNNEEGLKKLEEVRQLTRGALAEMRTLLFELRPAALADAELPDLLRQLAESVTGRARVPVMINIEGNCETPADVKIALYRIAQESLNNIVKHSGASRAGITLQCQPRQITMQIVDNGHGFEPAKTAPGSFGLGNMKERSSSIGASLDIESKVNGGAKITVVWHDDVREVP
jgi:PAS domain S-box-containing protein